MIAILFVCLGNICRSPALEGVMKKLLKERELENKIFVDSCATTSYYLGCPADSRIQSAAKEWGITLESRAKLFEPAFFDAFDYIFAVDHEVLAMLKSLTRTSADIKKLHLATEFAHKFKGQEMPDPYYGNEKNFKSTMEIANDACIGILNKIEKR